MDQRTTPPATDAQPLTLPLQTVAMLINDLDAYMVDVGNLDDLDNSGD